MRFRETAVADAVLTLDAGATSVRFALFETGGQTAVRLLCQGAIQMLAGVPVFNARDRAGVLLQERRRPGIGLTAMLGELLDFAADALDGGHLLAVGHRVAHGGFGHAHPARVTPSMVAVLERLVPLAPSQLPRVIETMRAIALHRPGLAQVACFVATVPDDEDALLAKSVLQILPAVALDDNAEVLAVA